jgi:peptidoglycan/xylan/chitin deacetylase (PgdA/CDA1 family)
MRFHRFGRPAVFDWVRRVPGSPGIFLTFDDGPDPDVTPRLLDLFDELAVRATFFVIGEKAARHRAILRRMLAAGHGVGDHSWDHTYSRFFQARPRLHAWIRRSQQQLEDLTGRACLGFRSPAGVTTPPLLQTLRELDLPLLHWNRRYFDTCFAFTPAKARCVGERLCAGDVVLLHDGNSKAPAQLTHAVRAMVQCWTRHGSFEVFH